MIVFKDFKNESVSHSEPVAIVAKKALSRNRNAPESCTCYTGIVLSVTHRLFSSSRQSFPWIDHTFDANPGTGVFEYILHPEVSLNLACDSDRCG